MIVDIAAGYISMRHGFKGPNYSPVAACASSTIAIIDAFHLIRVGRWMLWFVGVAMRQLPGGIGGFSAMRALSRRNDDYKTASRPTTKTGMALLWEREVLPVVEAWSPHKIEEPTSCVKLWDWHVCGRLSPYGTPSRW